MFKMYAFVEGGFHFGTTYSRKLFCAINFHTKCDQFLVNFDIGNFIAFDNFIDSCLKIHQSSWRLL